MFIESLLFDQIFFIKGSLATFTRQTYDRVPQLDIVKEQIVYLLQSFSNIQKKQLLWAA